MLYVALLLDTWPDPAESAPPGTFSLLPPLHSPASPSLTPTRLILLRMQSNVVVRAAVELKPPPYALNALEPHMSENTLNFHWGKHHRAYVDNLNGQIKGTDLESKSLEEIVVASWNNGSPTASFNNAAQVRTTKVASTIDFRRVSLTSVRTVTYLTHLTFPNRTR